MDSVKKYRMGVLGLGEGRSIISAAVKSEHWELVNVCDVNETLCQERVKEFGLQKYTLDYNEMLRDKSIDVIAIYTPDQLHGQHIRQALEAGKHVICTKPIIPSLNEAKELLEVQSRSDHHVFVGQSSRFFEPMLHQRRDFEKGLHGEVVSLETHYNTDGRWFLQKGWSLKKGFTWMYGFMIHALDLARWYFPDIVEVYGTGVVSANTKEYGMDSYDTVHFLLKDSEGKFAVVGGSYAKPTLESEVEPSIKCTLRGTKGISRAEYSKLKYHTNFDNEGYKTHTFDDKHDYYFRFEKENHHAGEYQNYIEHFARCLDAGEIPKPDLKEGLKTIAVMTAMQKSLDSGEVVKIKDIINEYGIDI